MKERLIDVRLTPDGYIKLRAEMFGALLTVDEARELRDGLSTILNDEMVRPNIKLMPTALHLAHNVTHLMKNYGLDFDQAMAIVRESPPS